MKKLAILLLTAAMTVSMAACGKSAQQNNSTETKQEETSDNNTSGDDNTNDDAKDNTGSDKKNDTSDDTKDNTKDNTGSDAQNLTASDIEKQIADAIGADNYLCDTEIDEDTLQNFYGLDITQIEDYAAKQNSISSVNPDTVVILKVKDGYADTAVEKLNTSYAQMVDYIRMYPFGTAKVLQARIYTSDNYVMYVIAGESYDGEDAEEENKFAASEYEKIDTVIKNVFGAVPENLAIVPEAE